MPSGLPGRKLSLHEFRPNSDLERLQSATGSENGHFAACCGMHHMGAVPPLNATRR